MDLLLYGVHFTDTTIADEIVGIQLLKLLFILATSSLCSCAAKYIPFA